ncbi:MAG: hypothetical protein HN742_23685 [Lentisphaerae bacterium]|nr:hypothetical protein [Lentisphaerota bacterium]MBT5605230.1 hypothetical protein [Lentisphaerota bacterium]MBT7054318.1 hypothetical protein [Lentisphaerota bacterium]MBT7844898.1 hypothetical protein [Lentisphaerota bacterium]
MDSNCWRTTLWRLLAATFVVLCSGGGSRAFSAEPRRTFQVKPAQANEHLTCYVSSGDHHNLHYAAPVDSPQSVAEYFELVRKVYGAQRIYWRGMQANLMHSHSVTRPENFYIGDYAEMEHDIWHADGLTDKSVVEEAHRQGLEIWGFGLGMDLGWFPVDDAAKGYGPSFWQWKLLAAHPEWAPIDRYGIRRKSGPICYAYPEARKALVKLFAALTREAGYDGVIVHTYLENFQTRILKDEYDEFGFNAPIAAEYKRRYGIDILHEEFDRGKLSRLRGEYFTQFLRELRDTLKQQGVKIGMMMGPLYPDYPSPWSHNHHMIVSGLVYFDRRTWIKEGLVDSFLVWCSGNPFPLARALVEDTRGTAIKVELFSSGGQPDELISEGVQRVFMGSYDTVECGYFQALPESALGSDDSIARLTVFDQAVQKQTTIPNDRLILAMRDRSVYVRRRAVIAVGKLKIKAPEVLDAVRTALLDPEMGVRSYAAEVLLKLGDRESVRAVYSMLDQHHRMTVDLAVTSALAKTPKDRDEYFLEGLRHRNPDVRKTVVRAARTPPRPTVLPALLTMADDSSAHVRWQLAEVLGTYVREPEARRALERLLVDPHATVRGMAALKLSRSLGSNSLFITPEAARVLDTLSGLFCRYNDSYRGVDREWGWRCIAEALLLLNPRGRDRLRQCLVQRDDATMAENAWYALAIRNTSVTWNPVEWDEAEASYAMHPRLWQEAPAFSPKPEPPVLAYIVQDFEGDLFSAANVEKGKGRVGGYADDCGYWFTLGEQEENSRVVALQGARGGKRAMQLPRRERGYLTAYRSTGISQGKIYVSFSLRLKSRDSAVYIRLAQGSSQKTSVVFRVTNGTLKVNGQKGAIIDTGYTVPMDEWLRFRLLVDLPKHTWSLAVGNNRTEVATDMQLGPESLSFNRLTFHSLGKDGTVSYLDDLLVAVQNPLVPEGQTIDWTVVEQTIENQRHGQRAKGGAAAVPVASTPAVVSPKRSE